MIVVDTNVLVYLLIEGKRTSRAENLYLREPDWAAPALWRSEFVNVLCTYLRQGRLDLATSLELNQAAETILDRNTFSIPALRTLEVSKRTGCSGYDSEFIALAEDLGVRLLTYDAKILQACPELAAQP